MNALDESHRLALEMPDDTGVPVATRARLPGGTGVEGTALISLTLSLIALQPFIGWSAFTGFALRHCPHHHSVRQPSVHRTDQRLPHGPVSRH